jgi:hypothetical protein
VVVIVVGRMECSLGRRQGEDQPTMTRIDRFKLENVAEECAVGVSVFAEENPYERLKSFRPVKL